MTDKLRQAAQQMLEAVADLTILTPREWQAVHGLKIDALRDELAEQPAEQEPVGIIRADGTGWFVEWRVSIVELGVDRPLYITPQPAIPPGYKLVPEVPTNEWINNLARRQTGSLEDVPFAEIHQCIAELLESAPEAPQPAIRALKDKS